MRAHTRSIATTTTITFAVDDYGILTRRFAPRDKSGMYDAGTTLSRITKYSEGNHVTETKWRQSDDCDNIDVTIRSDDAEGNLILRRERNGVEIKEIEKYAKTKDVVMTRMAKVPGCTSNVEVGVIKFDGKIRVFGVSDASVSRGIMWLVCNILSGISVEEVLECDASEFTKKIALDVGLSEGRGNGIGNIVRTVQRLLISGNDKEDEEEKLEPKKLKRPKTAVLLSGGEELRGSKRRSVLFASSCNLDIDAPITATQF